LCLFQGHGDGKKNQIGLNQLPGPHRSARWHHLLCYKRQMDRSGEHGTY
jgi:hypothetical protein